MSELLPCPFCGSVRAPEVSDVGECEECSKFDDCGRRLENRTCEGCDRWERPMFVVCNYNISGCGASGPYRKTEAEAIAAWNSRAERTCKFDYEQAAEYWQRMYEQTFAERTCHDTGENEWHFVCSACGYEQNGYECWNYCPNCGCKVVGE